MQLQWTDELEKQMKEFQLYEHFTYIALAQHEGNVIAKIGHTSNVKKRMTNLCNTSALEIEVATILCARSRADGIMMESMLHTLLRAHRTHGEWFKFELGNATQRKVLNDAVKAVQTMYGTQRVKFDVARARVAGREIANRAFAAVTDANLRRDKTFRDPMEFVMEHNARSRGEAIAMELERSQDRAIGRLALRTKVG